MLEIAHNKLWMNFWNLNIVIIEQHDNNKHDNNGPMDQLKYNLYF